MYFFEVNLFLSSCFFYLTTATGFHGLGTGFRRFLNEFNSSVALFDSSTIETKWLEQPLDHFDKDETRVWKMRYFERLDYWKKDGPVYLFISGEWKASEAFLQTGLMYDLARETNGAMYLSEHRYYGNSKPFAELSTENLKYLSSKQALADVARLLEEIKMVSKLKHSKVVVVGGSYAGNLAAWMKLLYPELVDAAIASSAPVLAQKDFYEYLETVNDDFEQHGTPGCLNEISEIFRRYDKLFQSISGIEQLKKEEQICSDNDMNKAENRQLFFLDKASAFMSEAQYGSPKSIKGYCQEISVTLRVISSKEDDTHWIEKNNCYDYDFDSMIENMKEVDWATAWTYQTCTEFGYYQTTTSKKQPFTNNIPVNFFYKWCTISFGPDFNENRIDEGIVNTNLLYGGLKPNVTHVVFSNGGMDPWSRLGVLEDVSYDAPAKVISSTTHCRDLFSDRSEDPEELKEARKYIKYLIKKWIGAGEFKQPEKRTIKT